ncbi:MAG: hypothetical protein ACLUFI_06390 [Oscillospiraceae bacterium]
MRSPARPSSSARTAFRSASSRRFAARGAKLVDATCPFVKKIHVIARQAEEAGRHLLIIGTPTHPEVTGHRELFL